LLQVSLFGEAEGVIWRQMESGVSYSLNQIYVVDSDDHQDS
jgi:hypothetical protein